MLQLKNNTPFVAEFVLLPNLQGVDSLYVMVKATFSIGEKWTLADQQLPLYQADEYYGEPGESSLKHAGEYHIEKTATDILMYGLACSPAQKPIRQMDIGLEVGVIKKAIRVFGDRCWQNQQITQPNLFVNMPLVYERAFGGSDPHTVKNFNAQARNPVGKGLRRAASSTDELVLPNLELFNALIRYIDDSPEPACFGPIAPNWHPRVNMGGTYDQEWQQQRAPYLPDDFNPRFLNCAPQDQIYPGFLQGGEPVHIIGMHPDGDFQFHVPYVNLSCKAAVKGETLSAPFNLETLALYPNQRQVAITWRASLSCDKRTLNIGQITVSMTR